MVQNGMSYGENSGLLHILPAAINQIYIITNNLHTEDGLLNGAICVLKMFEYKMQDKRNQVNYGYTLRKNTLEMYVNTEFKNIIMNTVTNHGHHSL